MHSELANPNLSFHSSKTPSNNPDPPSHSLGLLEASLLQSDDQIEVRNLSALASFSLDNLILHFEREQQS
jgi:hypothetical protein